MVPLPVSCAFDFVIFDISYCFHVFFSEEDFKTIVSREAPVHTVIRDKETQAGALRNEYLLAMVQTGHQYSVCV